VLQLLHLVVVVVVLLLPPPFLVLVVMQVMVLLLMPLVLVYLPLSSLPPRASPADMNSWSRQRYESQTRVSRSHRARVSGAKEQVLAYAYAPPPGSCG
jgi:hypothetical protein